MSNLKIFKVQKVAEECVHYFVIQAVSRTLILYFWINSSLNRRAFDFIFLALSIKLGIFPFHSWYLNLIRVLSWELIWVLRIPIKLVILKIIFCINLSYIFISLGGLNVLFSFFIIFKEKKIKPFLAITSLFNIGWVLLSLRDLIIWMIYILIYRINLYLLIERIKINKNDRLFEFNIKNSKLLYTIVVFVGLVLMRVPPRLGFIVKMLIFIFLLKDYFLIRLIILILSLIITYYYIIIFYYLNLSYKKSLSFFVMKTSLILKLINLNLRGAFILIIFIIYYLNNKV